MTVNVQKAVFAWLLLPVAAFAGVYDDVTWWMRGTYNGTSPDRPTIDSWHEIVHALEIGNPSIDADAYSHVTPYGAGDDVLHVVTDVACPYAGKTLKNRSVVRLAQTVKENGQDGSLVGRSSVLLMYMTGAAYETTANTNRYTEIGRAHV